MIAVTLSAESENKARTHLVNAPSSGGAPIQLEALVRNLAAITAVFYVCGFMTTNAYLYRLGVADFSLLRTRFILTGVLALTPLLQGVLWGIFAAVDVEVFTQGRRLTRRGYLFVLADFLFLFVVYFALFAFAADNEYVTAARQAALLSVLCIVTVLLLLGGLVYYRASEHRPISKVLYRGQPMTDPPIARRFGVQDTIVESVAVAVTVVILLLIYLTIFGDRFYAYFPEQMGGGRPRTAQMVIAASAIPAAQQLGFAVGDDDTVSEPVELLWVGEENYVVRLPPPNGRAVVQIARGLVDGVITGPMLEPEAAGVAP